MSAEGIESGGDYRPNQAFRDALAAKQRIEQQMRRR